MESSHSVNPYSVKQPFSSIPRTPGPEPIADKHSFNPQESGQSSLGGSLSLCKIGVICFEKLDGRQK